MPRINVLDKQVAELIAAGEVVERPASVVKELLENAVDAGATAVTVEIQNGGVSYIRITDNGYGIERADVRNAFLRHATSKVRVSEDLNHIMTMGFRGEALASVAAMAKVEVLTRTQDEDAGTHYAIWGGEEQLLEDAGCPVGTTIMVRDLFYNTPARMKFLKKDASEGNSVGAVVEKVALAYPEVSFRLLRDGVQKLHTPGDGKLLSAVRCALGREFSDNCIEVDYELDGLHLTGVISKPQAARGSRALQNFFINRRFVRSKTCMAALEEAYRGTLMVGRFPSCVLNLAIPAQTVDVNVHPAKIEVRFSDEKGIFGLVHYGCKTALGAADLMPRMTADSRKSTQQQGTQRISAQEYRAMTAGEPAAQLAFATPVAPAQTFSQPSAPVNIVSRETMESPQTAMASRSSADFPGERVDALPTHGITPPRVTARMLDIETPEETPDVPAMPLHSPAAAYAVDAAEYSDGRGLWQPAGGAPRAEDAVTLPKIEWQLSDDLPEPPQTAESERHDPFDGARMIGELFETYIVLQAQDDLILVDKHAAHERLIFNRMINGGLEEERQLLLSPVSVRLSAEEYSAAVEHLALFSDAGLTLEDFGDCFVVIREVVPVLANADLPAIVTEFAQKLLHENKRLVSSQMIDLYHTAACRAAMKANDKTPAPSLEQLLKLLREDADVRHCPHGRPVAVRMSKHEIEKKFGRLG